MTSSILVLESRSSLPLDHSGTRNLHHVAECPIASKANESNRPVPRIEHKTGLYLPVCWSCIICDEISAITFGRVKLDAGITQQERLFCAIIK